MVSEWNPKSLAIFNTHQTFANISIWYFTVLLALRFFLHIKKRLNQYLLIIIFLLSLLGSYFVYQTGFYGGKLGDENILKSTSTYENKK